MNPDSIRQALLEIGADMPDDDPYLVLEMLRDDLRQLEAQGRDDSSHYSFLLLQLSQFEIDPEIDRQAAAFDPS